MKTALKAHMKHAAAAPCAARGAAMRSAGIEMSVVENEWATKLQAP